jgi:hypothetical protein
VKILRDVPMYGPTGKVERIVHAAVVMHWAQGDIGGWCREVEGFMFLDERPFA